MKGRTTYTEADKQFIRDHYKVMSDKEISRELGKKALGIKNFRKKNGLCIIKQNRFSEMDEEVIRRLYPHYKTEAIAMLLGQSIYSVYNKACKMGITKTKEFLRSPYAKLLDGNRGKEFRFKKGNVPANKGKKLSPEQIEKMRHTFFGKGHEPKNTLWDGAITIRTHKSGLKYQYIRLGKGIWKELHRHVWEEVNGPVPAGYNVVFKDGDQMNCVLENLEMISNAELLNRQSIHNYPGDLRSTILVLGQLKRQIKEHGE